jgi:AraC family transcriptional regulator, arabinose operon regulatory protein
MRRRELPWLEMLRGPHSGPAGWAHFRDPTPSAEALGLWVNSVGYIRDRGVGAVIADRTLGCYGAVLVARGRAWFDSAPTGRREVGEGTLVWMFPDVAHSYAPLTEEWLEYWVHFDGPVAERIQSAGHLRPDAALASVGTDEAITTLFQRLKDAFVDERAGAELEAASLVMGLVSRARAIEDAATGTGRVADALVRRALALVDHGALTRGFSPEAVAKKLRVPYSTLRRRIRDATGESLKGRIQRVRLGRAKELLAVSTLGVEQIAYACGYSRPSYFVRAFHASEGRTPGEFRRAQGRV